MITFSVADFRAINPEFADVAKYPDSLIQLRYTEAQCYNTFTAPCITVECNTLLAYYLTAHILKLAISESSGDDTGQISSATIDKISVSKKTFDARNALEDWLFQTAYGKKYKAMLKSASAGLRFIGSQAGPRPMRNNSGFYNA